MDSEILSHAAELRDIYSTLHLVYYRNRNQHRNCKWWKWLSILKRSTSKLIKDIEELDDNIEIDVEGRLKARTRHLRSQVVPRCYLEFSTVVADNQFSTVGVVLIAILARISKLITGENENPISSTGLDIQISSCHAGTYDSEDMGELVGRPANADVSTPSLVSTAQPQTKNDYAAVSKSDNDLRVGPRERAPKATGQTKKKKKRGNEIDDIFNSLV